MKVKKGYYVLLLVLVFVAVVSWHLLTRGKVLARAEQKDDRGYPFSITFSLFKSRYQADLIFNNRLLVSSYAFYGGTDPPEDVIIEWPELGKFRVITSYGWELVRCLWDYDSVYWEAMSREPFFSEGEND